jgi:hypothetical protein
MELTLAMGVDPAAPALQHRKNDLYLSWDVVELLVHNG